MVMTSFGLGVSVLMEVDQSLPSYGRVSDRVKGDREGMGSGGRQEK